MFRFEFKIAIRHLIHGGTQTWLTVGTVALGAFLIVLLSSIINGVQQRLFFDILGSIPNITITSPDYEARRPWQVGRIPNAKGPIVTQVEPYTRQRMNIEQWQKVADTVKRVPGIVAIAPTAEGGGIVSRGAKEQSALVLGVIPEKQLQVVRLRDRIITGNFEILDSNGVFIGLDMAKDLSVGVGDKIRIRSNQGIVRAFTIRGIFDLGLQNANKSWVYLQLRSAQGLLGLHNDVTTINIKVNDLFNAEQIAQQIRKLTPLKVESWISQNPNFLQALQSQNTSSYAIQFIAVMASALGVSSVLIVFVVQKAKDIGILKSMGATSRQIQRIFTLEGVAIGAGGAILGTVTSTAICLAIQAYKLPDKPPGAPNTIIPMMWEPRYVIIALVVAITIGFLSSFFPARRAANLNPVEVIRGG